MKKVRDYDDPMLRHFPDEDLAKMDEETRDKVLALLAKRKELYESVLENTDLPLEQYSEAYEIGFELTKYRIRESSSQSMMKNSSQEELEKIFSENIEFIKARTPKIRWRS